VLNVRSLIGIIQKQFSWLKLHSWAFICSIADIQFKETLLCLKHRFMILARSGGCVWRRQSCVKVDYSIDLSKQCCNSRKVCCHIRLPFKARKACTFDGLHCGMQHSSQFLFILRTHSSIGSISQRGTGTIVLNIQFLGIYNYIQSGTLRTNLDIVVGLRQLQ